MKRNEARAFIDAFVKLRELATNDMALQVPNLYPTWKFETIKGTPVEYKAGQRVLYNEILYKVLNDHTAQEFWTPDVSPSLFAKVLIPDESVIPEWIQPDSTNAYMKGDKVIHNDKTWISDYDNNSWEPGIFGWTEI